jgi:hypothetical protein
MTAQAEKWIHAISTRRRKPVKPATIFGWHHTLDKWILPNIGDNLLAEVSNGVLRQLVDKMVAAWAFPEDNRELFTGRETGRQLGCG